jgi:hypothetical protein
LQGASIFVDDTTLCGTLPASGIAPSVWLTVACGSPLKGTSIKIVATGTSGNFGFCGLKVEGAQIASFASENPWTAASIDIDKHGNKIAVTDTGRMMRQLRTFSTVT